MDEATGGVVVMGVEGNTTTTMDNVWARFLPRALSLATSLIARDSDTKSALREEAEKAIDQLASKVISFDPSSFVTLQIPSEGFEDFALGSFWSFLSIFMLPLLVAVIVWYFVTTFVLRKNILALGRSGRLDSEERHQTQDQVERLTASVLEAVERLDSNT
ncbi:hypothetical protein Pmani_032440 [Petrolisthes manimaculis]|uniref:Uncharacterized protein n=1 Tax=Petrolisthes manimaculis TaxID=1843537 RepID=A0AAE1NRQ1_9EUCA|nr:hypothetical protein Pmani_032440 [Petrolisthes manimaculis]